ncbi:MAG: glycosyl hydrolase, repeat-containing protein [Chthoniobacteraceae bacterium]|nr:glycosyl hydrolase, repeat-containing protein [Chthoniobacteraceae bacterium]
MEFPVLIRNFSCMFLRLTSLFLTQTFLLALRACGGQPVEIIPQELRGAIQPQVAMSPDGGVHVVFGKTTSIYYTGSKDGGATFSVPVRIADLPKLALGMRRGPRIAATESLLTVSAISHGNGNLYSWHSADHGTTWRAGQTILNDVPNSAREGLHAMAGNGTGLLATVWLDMRGTGMEIWSSVSHDGGAEWGPNRCVYKSPAGHVCECCHPNVAIDSQGRIAIMFRNWLDGSRDMYMVSSADGGLTFSSAQKLGAGTWKLDGCPMDGGALTFSAPGKIVSAWRREKTAFATGSNPDIEERLADSAAQPVVVAGDFGIAQIWQQDGGLMLRKGSATPVRLAGGAIFAAAASVPGYKPMVVWESNVSGIQTLLAAPLD